MHPSEKKKKKKKLPPVGYTSLHWRKRMGSHVYFKFL